LLGLRGVDAKMAALRDQIVDGQLDLDMEPAPERNTLITTAVPQWTKLFGGARAVGEEAVARAALRRMEATCGTGRRWPERPLHVGVQNLGAHLMTRWANPLTTAELAMRGYKSPKGPILREAPWTKVLVTKAISTDGSLLDLSLRPIDEAVRATLRFDTLLPGREYRFDLRGETVSVHADADGVAVLDVMIDRPLDAMLAPV
jgi:hypothetical protein